MVKKILERQEVVLNIPVAVRLILFSPSPEFVLGTLRGNVKKIYFLTSKN
jgi:hypothetical protein